MKEKRFRVAELLKSEQEMNDIVLEGWVRTRRDLKSFSFFELNDGSCFKNIQVIVEPSLDNYEEIKKASTGASLRVEGDLLKSPGKDQAFEIKGKKISIYGLADSENYPLQKKGISFELLRNMPHLRSRTNTFGAVFRIRSRMSYAIHDFFQKKGFVHVHTPIITASDCEGAGEMFKVTSFDISDISNLPKDDKGKLDFSKDFFGREAKLTVSGQLEGELFAMSHGLIYTFGPTFRAEKSHTYRHASEFWMLEPEMAFYDLNMSMDLSEEMIKFLISDALSSCKDDMEFFDKWIDKGLIKRLELVRDSYFERITYDEAIRILQGSGEIFDIKPEWGIDLGSEHEKYLTDKHFMKPVFVYNYPKDIKSFYMKQNQDGKTVAAADLLVPETGELIGGSQREEDYDKLISAIRYFDLDEKEYGWYLDTRRFGTVPHAGFGLGFERFLMFLMGMKNIRDVIPFPRTPGNIRC